MNNNRKYELEQKKAKLEEFKRRKLQRLNNNNNDFNGIIKIENNLETMTTTGNNNNNDNDNNLVSKIDLNDIEQILNEIESKQNNKSNDKIEKIFIKNIGNQNKKKVSSSLTLNKTNIIEIPSKELITYSKETQTSSTSFNNDNLNNHNNTHIVDNNNNNKNLNENNKQNITKPLLPLECFDGPFIYDTLQWEDEFHSNSSIDLNHSNLSYDASHHLLNHYSTVNDITTDDEELVTCLDSFSSVNQTPQKINNSNKNEIKQFKIETNSEKQKTLFESNDFYEFIRKKSNILEKALNQEDIFYDYGIDLEKDASEFDTGEVLKLNREFFDEKYKNRVVTCLDWSPFYPELLLASYENGYHEDGDGVALIWNLKFEKSTPEYVFNCSSWVTSCCFTNFHPNLIIAGTYSGQVVMWDTRSSKRTPIQRSSLAITSHMNPVYCCKVLGTQNANNLLSISNDGRMCTWTLDNMNVPVTTLDLHIKQTTSIPVTCMDFKSNNDLNNFMVGTEDAYAYTVSRHGKTGINEVFEGHYGPITSISCNQSQEPFDFSNIFLTSSFDWSIKLWNMAEPSTPIYSFEDNNEYVYDVSWSPIHPALFASCDGNGRLDLWNLINDSEIPSSSLCINDGMSAINKLKWSKCGTKISIGDDFGKINIIDINESISRPKSDDSKKLVNVINELKQNYIDLQEIHGINRSMSQILAANSY